MTAKMDSPEKKPEPPVLRFSLDTWAVFLALGLSLLIWAGVIKHVSW
jgi:hypothetical protein